MLKKDDKELDLKLEEGEEKVICEDKDEASRVILTEEEENAMEELLKDRLPVIPEEGTKIKGKVLAVDTHSLFVDLGEMGVGIIYGKEVKDGFGSNRKKLKIGDEITASVIDQENEDGYVEL